MLSIGKKVLGEYSVETMCLEKNALTDLLKPSRHHFYKKDLIMKKQTLNEQMRQYLNLVGGQEMLSESKVSDLVSKLKSIPNISKYVPLVKKHVSDLYAILQHSNTPEEFISNIKSRNSHKINESFNIGAMGIVGSTLALLVNNIDFSTPQSSTISVLLVMVVAGLIAIGILSLDDLDNL
jgi:hypothetical protein